LLFAREAPVVIDPALLMFLARHGETEFNRANRFCGEADSPLTEHGREEARRNGQVLSTAVGEALGTSGGLRLVSSPLQRAMTTARIIRTELGQGELPIATDDRLREISFGAWEGLTLDEIKSRYPREWAARVADRWHTPAPGGESYADVAARVGGWLGELHGTTLVVTHGAVDRILRGLYVGMAPEEICKLPEPQDEVFRLNDGAISVL
jgi:broad specificity phosphatase PhoE